MTTLQLTKNALSSFVAHMKQNNLDLEWACDTRVDLLSADLLKEMREAGCRTIFFGIQSGSQRILEKLNTHTTPEKIEAAFKLCRKAGINIAASFMLGIPGETVADMETTYKFAKKTWSRLVHFLRIHSLPNQLPLRRSIREASLRSHGRLFGFCQN